MTTSDISPIDGGSSIDRGDVGEGRGDGSSPGWGSNIGLPGKLNNGMGDKELAGTVAGQ